jgi:hypothetical protein
VAEKTVSYERDLEMIENPNRWPNWPVLPVKRPRLKDDTGFPQLGVIFEVPAQRYTVHVLNMIMFAEAPADQHEKLLREAEKFAYPDAAAMLADGWVVD